MINKSTGSGAPDAEGTGEDVMAAFHAARDRMEADPGETARLRALADAAATQVEREGDELPGSGEPGIQGLLGSRNEPAGSLVPDRGSGPAPRGNGPQDERSVRRRSGVPRLWSEALLLAATGFGLVVGLVSAGSHTLISATAHAVATSAVLAMVYLRTSARFRSEDPDPMDDMLRVRRWAHEERLEELRLEAGVRELRLRLENERERYAVDLEHNRYVLDLERRKYELELETRHRIEVEQQQYDERRYTLQHDEERRRLELEHHRYQLELQERRELREREEQHHDVSIRLEVLRELAQRGELDEIKASALFAIASGGSEPDRAAELPPTYEDEGEVEDD